MCSATQRVVEDYDHFAKVEAVALSPVYAAWARVVASDREIAGRLAALPEVKRQPNLLFSAVRVLYGLVDAEGFRTACHDGWDAIEPVIGRFPQDFLLAVDGTPVAWTQSYGRALWWR